MNVQIVDTDAQNKKIKIGLDKSQVPHVLRLPRSAKGKKAFFLEFDCSRTVFCNGGGSVFDCVRILSLGIAFICNKKLGFARIAKSIINI